MAKNSDMPGHAWKVMGTKYLDGYSYFVYSCTKCPAQTLNGMPLEPPYDKECK
jgi:hypothetical protein